MTAPRVAALNVSHTPRSLVSFPYGPSPNWRHVGERRTASWATIAHRVDGSFDLSIVDTKRKNYPNRPFLLGQKLMYRYYTQSRAGKETKTLANRMLRDRGVLKHLYSPHTKGGADTLYYGAFTNHGEGEDEVGPFVVLELVESHATVPPHADTGPARLATTAATPTADRGAEPVDDVTVVVRTSRRPRSKSEARHGEYLRSRATAGCSVKHEGETFLLRLESNDERWRGIASRAVWYTPDFNVRRPGSTVHVESKSCDNAASLRDCRAKCAALKVACPNDGVFALLGHAGGMLVLEFDGDSPDGKSVDERHFLLTAFGSGLGAKRRR